MGEIYQNKDVTLLEILDGILDKGVVASGNILISVANIDLIYVDLRLLITSVESGIRKGIIEEINVGEE